MEMNIKASASPTITDVARVAGVSIKTVSRVMNKEPGVHTETREHVLRVVTQMKYRPKLSARSLAGARSFLIGLLYYDPSAAFVSGVQQGATLRCREAGYHLVVESVKDDAPDLGQQVDQMTSALRPDGMILTPPLCENPHVLQALRESETPFVLISPERDSDGIPSVRMDDVLAAEQMTAHLISLGHKKIGFIKGPADQAASALRYKGFSRAMKAHALSVEKDFVYTGDFKFHSGLEGANKILSRRTRPTAIFASNDDMALGILASAQSLGLAVPDDLSVAGFDDSPAASLVWPQLTTIRQPTAAMARLAVEMLITSAKTADDEVQVDVSSTHMVLAHELVIRLSTGKPGKR